MTIANTKSLLAKLLATENLTVQHQNAPTASFNVKDRILTLPIFADGMSNAVYDLMVSHEVGHALWTPQDGWHDAVCDKGQVFKGFLNIIEDARIERKVKAKYPGLVKAYREGYAELLQKNFFGLEGHDITEMSFIDRINLHFKLGTLVNLKFEGDEAVWVEKIAKAETWDEVMDIANSIFEEEMEKAEEEIEQQIPAQPQMGGNQDSDDSDDSDDDGEKENNEPTQGQGSSKSDDNSDEDGEEEGDSSGDEDEEEGEEETTSNSFDYSDDEDFDDEDEIEEQQTAEEKISSITDGAFRSNEERLVKQSDKEYKYYKFDTIESSDMVIPFKKILSDYAEMWSMVPSVRTETEQKMALWKDNNTKIINYMVKEFELKKKADEFKRASVAKSGELDMKKVFQYKFNDDLFKRVTTVPGGKNHGFVMLLDWSGSMAPSMSSTIDQLINLVMFCRKVKIPFDVYAFTDGYFDREEPRYRPDYTALPIDTLVPGRHAKLMQLFSSDMKIVDFNEALLGLMGIRECLDNGRYYRFNMPSKLQLGGTPLDDALLVMPDLLNKFVAKYRTQITNLVVLTDGDSHNCDSVVGDEHGKGTYSVYGGYRQEQFVTDVVTKVTKKVDRSMTTTLIDLIGTRCKVNTIGFFVMENKPREIRNVASRFGIWNTDIVKTIREEKFAEVKTAGYDSYFLIPAGKEMETMGGFEVEDGLSKARLATAFKKNAKSKTANRVLLTRLMEIAA